MLRRFLFPSLLSVSLAFAGCAAPEGAEGEETYEEVGQSTDEIREVIPGPLRKSTDAEVWSVENQWADKSTPAARKAGVAWGEDSGLTWEEKYQKWASSFEKVKGVRYGDTIRLTTPYGRTLDGPVLDCADVTIWLRMSFASWYKLPFYMTGTRNGQAIYFGHFGIIDRNGDPIAGYPRFKRQYRDYESSWTPGQPWPSDATLRGRHVGPDDGAEGVGVDDEKLEAGAGAGAYFDELFLNKRAGYLMMLLDVNFGSMNLADGANMFHIKPEATAPGDALLQRWQRSGIGHTLPVVSVAHTPTGRMRISTASGSMPRRQPVWLSEAQSAGDFRRSDAGGYGEAADGSAYAKLGGGIRRWRTPVFQNGRWNQIVPEVFRSVYIEDNDVEQIAARPDRFKELLAEDSPEETRDAALATIEAARAGLLERPASCAQRTRREDAFDALYDVMSRSFGMSRNEVDAEYRQLDDYVFAELEYTRSKTCCWNSTTPAMADIILDYAAEEQAEAEAEGVCRQPTVFRASGGGRYETWKLHAASLGRASQWKDWSEDEPCAQRAAIEDTVGPRGTAPMCR